MHQPFPTPRTIRFVSVLVVTFPLLQVTPLRVANSEGKRVPANSEPSLGPWNAQIVTHSPDLNSMREGGVRRFRVGLRLIEVSPKTKSRHSIAIRYSPKERGVQP